MSDAVKKHNRIIVYEKEKKKMGNTSRKRGNQSTAGSGNQSTAGSGNQSTTSSGNQSTAGSGNQEEHIGKRVKETIVIVGSVLSIIAILAGAIMFVSVSLANQKADILVLNKDYDYLTKRDDDFEDKIDELSNKIDELSNKINDLTSFVQDDHKAILQLMSIDSGEKAYNLIFKDAFQIKVETIANEEYLADPLWGEDANGIAQDADSDKVYSPEDLYNTPIITSYMEDGKEIYFYGRFDENNRWNGTCILNIYSEDKLVSIYEGIYDKGTLYSYKRVEAKDDIWLVNDRVYQGEYNSGKTWKYVKTDDFVKNFSIGEIKEKQILTVKSFLESKEPELLSYYYGCTSNGLYNDKTGTAYLISYFERGELPGVEGEVIRTLYQGNFKDGDYDDNTGNAWYITREANTKYMYYAGTFSDGDADHEIEKEPPENPVDYDFIVQKLKEKGYEEYSPQFWVDY